MDMQFGLVGAPAVFQRMMNTILADKRSYAAAYRDDIVIHSTSWEDHLRHIRSVLEQLQVAGLTATPAKCYLGARECHYLGHIVGNGHVKPEQAKAQTVLEFAVSKQKNDVRTFLGLAGYYRRFKNFSELAAPLTI